MIVDLLPTDEQTAVADSVSALVHAQFPVRRLSEPDQAGGRAEAARWELLAGLGLFGMGVAESAGGVGFCPPAEVTVARELGRGLVSPTVLATMIAAHIAEGDVFAALLAGSTRVAFANPLVRPESLSGEAEVQLLDAEGAELVLLWTDGAGALYRRPESTQPVAGLDDTVRLERARINLAHPLAVRKGPWVARHAGLMLSAYLSAVAEGSMNLATEYAKVREQFGQPIGAFQSIKHYCAEMARRCEGAISQTYFATLDALSRNDDSMLEVAAARLLAGEAATTNGRFCIQIHGGMGFTYEAEAHFYLKRAILLSQLASSKRLEQIRIMESDA